MLRYPIAVAALALATACSAGPQSTQAQSAQSQTAQAPSAQPLSTIREPMLREDIASRVDALVKQADFEALDTLASGGSGAPAIDARRPAPPSSIWSTRTSAAC